MERLSSIIITKILLPQKRDDLLRRQRLVDFIHEHIDRKLILISASAGYGKTALLIDYAHDTDLPVCWYSLDKADQDPRIFMEYLVASIRQRFPHFGQRTQALLQTGEGLTQEMETIVGVLVNEIYEAIPQYFVVVLDDYHFVDDSEAVNTLLDTLLHYLPENCHILLSSRTLPRITLTRLVAQQQVVGLGVSDLRFTAQEIQELMRQNYNLDLPDKQAEELALQSEGWIAGLLLTTHTLWRGLFKDIIRRQRPEGGVFDYLVTEVFAQQPERVQRFLLDSSILKQMNPALCNELLGIEDSRDTLELLERKNLFIMKLESEGEWYRYHHLFRDFLIDKLRRDERYRHAELHRRAARLFERQGAHQEGIDHYLEAEAYEEAVQAIEAVAEETFNAGLWRTLANWIDALPEVLLVARPSLITLRARIYTQVGELDKALELFDRAHREFARQGDRAGGADTLVWKSIALRIKGQHQEAIDCCQRALSTLDEKEVLITAQAHRNIGICYGMQGKFSQGIRELEIALELYERGGDLYNSASLYHDLGTAHALMGSLSSSLAYYQRAQQYWRRIGNPPALGNTLNSIGVLKYFQGEYEDALSTLEEALDKVREAGFLRVEATVLASLGDVYRDVENYERALEAYEGALGVAEQANEILITVYTLNAMGDTHRLMGNDVRARELISYALEEGQRHQLGYETGLCKTSLGILCYAQGDTQQALEHLTRAQEFFQRCGAKRELARAHLHLAQTFFLRQEFPEALQHLETVLELTSQLGYDQFLVVEGRRTLPLLKYATSQDARMARGGYLARVMARIEEHEARMAERAMPEGAPEVAPVTPPVLEVYAFGQARVLHNSRLVSKSEWDSIRTKELFFYFLAHPQGLRKEQVMETFWGEAPPPKANSSFHSTNYRLRHALFHECVVKEDGLYRFNRRVPYWYDVEEFERLIKEAEGLDSDSEEAAERYRQAIALYRGDYLEEFYSDWCLLKREALREKYFAALMRLAAFKARRGEFGESIELYKKILARDDYREEAHREVMRCLALAGDRAAAIKYYQRLVQFLADELDAPPMPETVAVYEAIRRGDITTG